MAAREVTRWASGGARSLGVAAEWASRAGESADNTFGPTQ